MLNEQEVENKVLSSPIQTAILEDSRYKLLGMKAELSHESDIDVVLATRNPSEFVDYEFSLNLMWQALIFSSMVMNLLVSV